MRVCDGYGKETLPSCVANPKALTTRVVMDTEASLSPSAVNRNHARGDHMGMRQAFTIT